MDCEGGSLTGTWKRRKTREVGHQRQLRDAAEDRFQKVFQGMGKDRSDLNDRWENSTYKIHQGFGENLKLLVYLGEFN